MATILTALGLMSVGCSTWYPFSIGKGRVLRFDIGLRDVDFPVYSLSPVKGLYIGKFETESKADPGRTVVHRIGSKGREVSRLALPEGHFASAIHADDDGNIYTVCERQETDRNARLQKTWRILKLDPSGKVLWDRAVPEIENEGFRLVFTLDEWRNVQIISGPRKQDELSFIWYRSSSRPATGILTFSTATGTVYRLEDGVSALSEGHYGIDGEGVYRIEKGANAAEVFAFEDQPWSLEFLRKRLIFQVSADGLTGPLYYIHEDKALPVLPEPLRFPVRANSESLYVLDPVNQALWSWPFKQSSGTSGS